MTFINDWKINLSSLNSILKKRPIFVAWLITHRCNLRCRFCNFWEREVIREKELTVKEFAQASKKLTKLGVRVANLAGGEPFVRKDLPDIISQLSLDHQVIVNTNGTLINQRNAKAIFEAGTSIVNVSIDFFSKEKHDYYRGAGTYDKAVRALKILRDSRTRKHQKVAIQSILNPDNLDEIGELAQLCEELGIDFAFNPYRPGKHSVDFTIKQIFDIGRLYELKNRYRSFMATEFALRKTDEYLKKGFVPNCCAGKYMFAIDPYGEIVPCEDRVHISVGNINEITIADAVVGLERMYKANNCNNCWTRERSEVENLYILNRWAWLMDLFRVRR